jgi:gamma-glutamyltranspeptidase
MIRRTTCIGGMVSTARHLAAQVGAAVLREGDNAVEAMVAAAAAIGVVHPHMNGVGRLVLADQRARQVVGRLARKWARRRLREGAR